MSYKELHPVGLPPSEPAEPEVLKEQRIMKTDLEQDQPSRSTCGLLMDKERDQNTRGGPTDKQLQSGAGTRTFASGGW